MKHIGYVLLSHGARHTSTPLAMRPGARTQMERVERLASSIGHDIGEWRVDHVRTSKGARSFPNLFALLGWAKEHDLTGCIVIDDTSRLFRRLGPEAKMEMLAALQPYDHCIIDAHRRKPLSEFKSPEWFATMLTGANQSPAMRRTFAKNRQKDLRALKRARHVSKLSRSRLADHIAMAVFDLREELVLGGDAPSNVKLARVANERGLQTSRGKLWSDVTVARAIRRIEKIRKES